MDMMKSFIKCGCEVYAVGNEEESKWKEKFSEQGIVYKQIFVHRNGVNPFADLKTLSSIKSVLKEIKPDKIFTYQAKTVIYGGMAANQLGIKDVYPLIAGMGSVFIKNDLKNKVIRKVMTLEYRMGMRKSPVVFFQNHDDEQIFRVNKIIKKQKVVMIPGSGVNVKRFDVQPLPEYFAFLCISRLIRDKGVYEYLEASRIVKREHPEVKFLLVGPYDSNPSAIKPEELQPFINDGTIEYFGEQEDVKPYLAQCNVFVLPSYREGTPKTNLEAMACGRAIITTDAPGCKETVIDGENGYLVPVEDVNTLCEKMKHFIDNPNLVSAMGANGRKKAETIFNVEIVNGRICYAMGL
jgi:glycosyltransferase involved in cell wall biosynthesis